jgi:hypothetical protein
VVTVGELRLALYLISVGVAVFASSILALMFAEWFITKAERWFGEHR